MSTSTVFRFLDEKRGLESVGYYQLREQFKTCEFDHRFLLLDNDVIGYKLENNTKKIYVTAEQYNNSKLMKEFENIINALTLLKELEENQLYYISVRDGTIVANATEKEIYTYDRYMIKEKSMFVFTFTNENDEREIYCSKDIQVFFAINYIQFTNRFNIMKDKAISFFGNKSLISLFQTYYRFKDMNFPYYFYNSDLIRKEPRNFLDKIIPYTEILTEMCIQFDQLGEEETTEILEILPLQEIANLDWEGNLFSQQLQQQIIVDFSDTPYKEDILQGIVTYDWWLYVTLKKESNVNTTDVLNYIKNRGIAWVVVKKEGENHVLPQ